MEVGSGGVVDGSDMMAWWPDLAPCDVAPLPSSLLSLRCRSSKKVPYGVDLVGSDPTAADLASSPPSMAPSAGGGEVQWGVAAAIVTAH